ncbi:glycosyltransferase family 4 protein [bacterium]|nr:glycosyltransferase family 4 protein [bacterium]
MASSRLRVVQVLEATVGGTRKHVLDLCRGLDRKCFELHAILSAERDPAPEETRQTLEDAGVAVTLLPMVRGLSPGRDLACLRALERELGRLQPDIVHTHSAKAGVLGRIAAHRARVPAVLYTPHGFPFLMHVPGPLRLAYLLTERRLARITTRLIAVCDSEREVALTAGVGRPEQVVVIENGVAFGPTAQVDREAKRRQLGLPEEALVILCAGDVRKQKGHAYAVAALETVRRQMPQARLLVAGDVGAASGGLRRPADGSVQFLGPRDDVAELMACTDVFCQPSLWEGCPYAVIEAAGAGCAVVGSDIPGIRDIVHEGQTGWLARPGDSADLARALLAALADPQEGRRRGEAASALVRERYTLERMVAGTAQLYETVASETQGRTSGG